MIILESCVVLCPHCYARYRCKCCGQLPERLPAGAFKKDHHESGDFVVKWSDENCEEHKPQ